MPVQDCQKNGEKGYKFGEQGFCYTYKNDNQKEIAKKKAIAQGVAIGEYNFEETYTDYPQQAIENAKIALRWVEKNGWGDCGTPVGKTRANQLANGEPISRDIIARMSSFERHLQWEDKKLGDGCGRLMLLAWGGREGIEWAQKKLKEIEQEKINLLKEQLLLLFAAEKKIGFDFDNTLSTSKGKELFKRTQGNKWIVTARSNGTNRDVFDVALELGIPKSKIIFTGSNNRKVDYVKTHNFDIFYDNNESVIKQLGSIGRLFK